LNGGAGATTTLIGKTWYGDHFTVHILTNYCPESSLYSDLVHPKSTELPSPIYIESPDVCQSSSESNFSLENLIEETPSENIEPNYEIVGKEHVSEQVENYADLINFLISKVEECQKSVKEEISEKSRESNELFELAVTADKGLGHNKEKSLKTSHDIIDADEIKKAGVQIFRKPTKLFVFDSLKEWKIKGNLIIVLFSLIIVNYL